MSSGWGSSERGDLWESKICLKILLDLVSLHLVVAEVDGLDDMDGISSSAVATGHLVVQKRHGSGESGGSELLVHVDVTLSGQVSEHDAEVLD